MASRNIEQGIKAIQSGNHEEGARMLRFVLRDEQLDPKLRAVVYMWLAETSADVAFKVDCYRKANQADPTNADVSQRLNYWQTQNFPGAAPNPGDTGNYFPQQGNPQPPINPGDTDRYIPQQPNLGDTNPFLPPQQNRQQPNSGDTDRYFPQQPNPVPPNQPTVNNNNFWLEGTGHQIPPNQGTPQQGMPPSGWNTSSGGYNYPMISQNPLAADYGGNLPMAPQPLPNPADNAEQRLLLQDAPFSVGIVGGPNGNGSGVYITRDGLVATTRYVVGGQERVNVFLPDGRQILGQVVRSYPALDLALIQTNVQVTQLLRVTQSQVLPDQMVIYAVTHPGQQGQVTESVKRTTRHQTAAHWFPTMINRLMDAGGNPIYDQQNTLVGLLTKNTSRSSGYAYGLHILKVYEAVQQFYQEKQQNVGQTLYCFSCGIMSRAVAFNGFYCENCGSTLSYAVEITRYPQMNLVGLYGENAHRPCPNCNSQVGYYKGFCIRCGYEEEK